jgi:HEAT repeat protein
MERAAVPSLIRALESEAWQVREKAAAALGQIGDRRALRPLIETLQDKNDWVRTQAVWALQKLGDERAVDPLVRHLAHKSKSARWAAGALAHLGALSELVRALDDGRAEVREATVAGLRKAGEAGIPHLVRALEDRSKKVRQAAAIALGEAGDQRAIPELTQIMGDVHADRWKRVHAGRLLEQLGALPQPNGAGEPRFGIKDEPPVYLEG